MRRLSFVFLGVALMVVAPAAKRAYAQSSQAQRDDDARRGGKRRAGGHGLLPKLLGETLGEGIQERHQLGFDILLDFAILPDGANDFALGL